MKSQILSLIKLVIIQPNARHPLPGYRVILEKHYTLPHSLSSELNGRASGAPAGRKLHTLQPGV